MLVKLSVQNYALIRELDVSFGKGLTVITGETGAGKSILLGALSLVLGSRADTGVLLDKSSKCMVEATFNISGYDLEEFFAAGELDYDDTTIIRREINPAGKSRAFVNDTPVTLNILKELGDKLIDIHSQHQTLMLNQNGFQLNVIDSFAGNSKLIEDYRKTYRNYRILLKEYNSLKERSDRNKADLDYYRFQLNQIEQAKLLPGEQEELEREQEILSHTGEISQALTNSSAIMSSDESSVLLSLRMVKQHLAKISGYFPEAGRLIERIDSSYIELDDLASEIGRISSGIEDDPSRLKSVEERLDLIYSLIQKHRVRDLGELIGRQEELRETVKGIVTGDERLEELEELISSDLSALKSSAEKISANRAKIIPSVESEITSILRQLGMPNARFRIEMRRSAEFTSSGIDDTEFLFSANRQVEPENIARVASGGELSRVMLSLKSFLTLNTGLPTIIFDEIDSGVSGEVADRVGSILAGMGKQMQVINITHLPQVASKGDEHWHVYKDDTRQSTITRVKLLSSDERIREIARLLSGSEITETALRNARELLGAGMETK